MLVYSLLLLSWLVVAAIGSLAQSPTKRPYFALFAGFTMFVVMAVRAPTVGTDIRGYEMEYLTELWREQEPGISFLMSLARDLGLSFQGFLALVAGIICIAVTWLFIRYSAIPLLSFFLFITAGFFAMSLSGLRQSLAVAITIFAFMVLMRGHRVLFVAFVLLATTFHESAIFFLLVILVPYVRFTRRSGLFVLLAFIPIALGVILTQQQSTAVVLDVLELDKYRPYTEVSDWQVNPLTAVVAGIVPLAALLLWPPEGAPPLEVSGVKPTVSVPSVLLCMSLVGFAISVAGLEIPQLGRLGYYFVIYSNLLVPAVIAPYPYSGFRHMAIAAAVLAPFVGFWISTPGDSLGIENYEPFWSQNILRWARGPASSPDGGTAVATPHIRSDSLSCVIHSPWAVSLAPQIGRSFRVKLALPSGP